MKKVMVVDGDCGVVFVEVFGDIFMESKDYGSKENVINEFLDIGRTSYYDDKEYLNEFEDCMNKLKVIDGGKWFLGSDEYGMLCVGVEFID
jgi:hypothetical protein